jgi:hypothetical protein
LARRTRATARNWQLLFSRSGLAKFVLFFVCHFYFMQFLYSLVLFFQNTSLKKSQLLLVILFTGIFSAGAQSLPGPGNTLTFNGYNSYINCGNNNRGISQRVTAEAWIKTSSSAYQWVIGKYFNSFLEEKGFHLYVSGGRAGFNGRIGIGQYMTSGPSTTRIDDGRWHHLAGVCTFSTWQIYVDGVLENTGTYSASQSDLTTSTALVIGCYDVQAGQFFDGDIDEVRLWRTARSQSEIRDNMCRKFATAPADLVAYYRLDQSSGSFAFDNGSIPSTGTLINIGSWQRSGAPLGDASAHLYQAAWPAGSRLALATLAGDSAIVSSISSQTRGVQLYAVNSAPSIPPPGTAATSYVGVFTTATGSVPGSYSLRLRPTSGPACRNAFVRASNDVAWALPAQLPATATSLLVPGTSYRSEHILTAAVAASAAIVGDSVVCAGGRTQLSVVAPGSLGIQWSTGATSAMLGNVGAGTYSATVNFSSGCSRTLRRTVRVAAIPTVSITGDSALCPGRSTTLTAAVAGATGYRWSTGATTAALSISQPGSYAVVVSYGPGCTTSARREVRLNAALPAFALGADTTLCEGEQLVLQGPAGPNLRYLWSDNSTNRQLMVQTTGRYTLRVLNDCGEQSAARAVTVRSCLVVPNIITANADGFNDVFEVQGLRGQGWALEVFNRWGRSVFQAADYHNDWGRDATPGLYYILLRRPVTGYFYKGWLEVSR